MAGGLVQLTVYGTQDIFLTGTPEITFFKVSYRRHTNFAIESIAQEFLGSNDFGNEVTCVIDKIGDLMSKAYLEIEIPRVSLTKNPANWTINRQLALTNYQNALEFYQLVYNYVSTDTDVTRKLLSLCRTNNISMEDIVKTMNDPSFIGTLETQRKELQAYILLGENFNNITDLRDEKFYLFQEVNQIDVQVQFNSIVSINQDLNATNSINSIDSIIRAETIVLINQKLYGFIKEFYMKAYTLYVQKHKIYQSFVDGTYSENYQFAWVEELGHATVGQLDVKIGSQMIDRHTGDWFIAFNKIFQNQYQYANYNKMIGNVPELYTFNDKAKDAYRLIIPLQFWFCRHIGLAIPLVALRYHDVLFTLRYKELADLCYFEDNPVLIDVPNVQSMYGINMLGARMYVDYIFLDADERKRFAQSTHEYLIELVQFSEFNDLEGKQYNARLSFAHPTKFILWFVQPNQYRSNPTGRNKCQWNNYGTRQDKTGYTIENEFIRLNSSERTDINQDIKFFNYVQPYLRFNNSPTDGFNVYSFALNPIEIQPSSTCNLSRIDDLGIVMIFTDEFIKLVENNTIPEIPNGYYLGVYVFSYNIIRIMSGMAGLAFQTSS